LLPQALLNKTAIANLETTSPKMRLNLGALWKKSDWTVNLRESVYGPSSGFGSINGSTYYETKITTKATTDLEVSYRVSKAIMLSAGANNLFNQYPNKNSADLTAAQTAALNTGAVTLYPSFSPIGINGGYYYGRLNYTF
jgi:iron complex outermembrane receptor protein